MILTFLHQHKDNFFSFNWLFIHFKIQVKRAVMINTKVEKITCIQRGLRMLPAVSINRMDVTAISDCNNS